MATNNTTHRSFFSGFTIVELIIVISIIGILASIAIVSYSGAQNRAKKNSFESSAQQVKLKLGDHLTDKNGYPRTKADVITYIGSTSALGVEFNKTAYAYNPVCANPAPALCENYEIVVAGSNFNMSAADSVKVSP